MSPDNTRDGSTWHVSEGSENPAPSQQPDYSTWLTKQQAADTIGVSTKTVEQLARGLQLQQAFWQRPTGGPKLAVYHPDDVARIAKDRHPAPSAFVVPADPAGGNGSGAHPGDGGLALVKNQVALGAGDDVLKALLGVAAALSARLATSQSSQKSEPQFLTLPEAAAYTGLSQAYLRRCIQDTETLPAVRDRGWKIRKRDLEAL